LRATLLRLEGQRLEYADIEDAAGPTGALSGLPQP
jgi:hypothetical protein